MIFLLDFFQSQGNIVQVIVQTIAYLCRYAPEFAIFNRGSISPSLFCIYLP